MTNDRFSDRDRDREHEGVGAADPAVIAASAYLDGEATEAERLLVETDPTVRSLSEQFATVSRQLRDLQAGDSVDLEPALAAALGAFDQRRSRWGSGSVLKIAAALLMIGALGVVAANLGSGSTEDSVDQFSDSVSPAPGLTDAEQLAEVSESLGDASTDAESQMSMSQSDHDAASEAESIWPEFDGPDQLAEFARSMVDADAVTSRAATRVDPRWLECAATESLVLGPARYQGSEALIVVLDIEQAARVQAIDPTTCALLVDISL
jgi:hypothetical protein